jgi:hypothetical protein
MHAQVAAQAYIVAAGVAAWLPSVQALQQDI